MEIHAETEVRPSLRDALRRFWFKFTLRSVMFVLDVVAIVALALALQDPASTAKYWFWYDSEAIKWAFIPVGSIPHLHPEPERKF